MKAKINWDNVNIPISELDKLAIIRELTNANFSPGSIPTNIHEIWSSLIETDQQNTMIESDKAEQKEVIGTLYIKFLPIDVRINNAYIDHYSWRFYASHALLFALTLLNEDSYSGLIFAI